MENAYAQALWRVIEAGGEANASVKKMHDSLARSARLDLWPKIAHAFKRLAEVKRRQSLMTITIADKAHDHSMRNAAFNELVELGIDAGNIETRVDPTIVGGWRLEGRGHLIDASYKKYLLDMYNRSVGIVFSDN
ncbi:MAG TPA: F0F1 ATP synthase subunit delta [Candidatus Paceibacterota bacterium]|nr:F0F1 ATP synthase subunit delta [Candidatus Paceibacterota bacterium]